MALDELYALRHSAIGILWTLFALRLQCKGVHYGALERLLGIKRRPVYALRQLYELELIQNVSNRPTARGKITLTTKGLLLMREVCSTR